MTHPSYRMYTGTWILRLSARQTPAVKEGSTAAALANVLGEDVRSPSVPGRLHISGQQREDFPQLHFPLLFRHKLTSSTNIRHPSGQMAIMHLGPPKEGVAEGTAGPGLPLGLGVAPLIAIDNLAPRKNIRKVSGLST